MGWVVRKWLVVSWFRDADLVWHPRLEWWSGSFCVYLTYREAAPSNGDRARWWVCYCLRDGLLGGQLIWHRGCYCA